MSKMRIYYYRMSVKCFRCLISKQHKVLNHVLWRQFCVNMTSLVGSTFFLVRILTRQMVYHLVIFRPNTVVFSYISHCYLPNIAHCINWIISVMFTVIVLCFARYYWFHRVYWRFHKNVVRITYYIYIYI